jgi:GT2 family glycosyltransferase
MSEQATRPEPQIDLEPAVDIVIENGRMTATSHEPWLRFRSVVAFEATRFVEITYRSSLYDNPVRPILKFSTAQGEIERILPGPVAGAGVWRGAVPRGIRAVLVSPAARPGQFDFRIESVKPLSYLEIAGLVWRRRPKKLWSMVLAATFGYFAEAENAMDWAVGAEPFERFAQWRSQRERTLDLSSIDAPRCDWNSGPTYLILIEARDAAPAALAKTIASLETQIYRRFVAVIFAPPGSPEGTASAFDARVSFLGDGECVRPRLADADFVAFLQAGDALVPHALALVTEEVARLACVKFLYGDEVIVGNDGDLPHFKPDWSPMFESARPYLGRCFFMRTSIFPSDMLPSQAAAFQEFAHNVALGCGRQEVIHLRRCLLSRGVDKHATTLQREQAPKTISGTDELPSVTIILLTRDRADLLAPCLDSLLQLSTHSRFELLIIDNGTRQAKALEILKRVTMDPRVRVLARPGPFNFAALNNEAARKGAGDVLLFLNNDTEIITPDWLEQLCRLALRNDVGAVGGMLLFPNGLIQHAGVVVGIGQDAGHFEALQPLSASSWLDRTASLRETSGVTAACMAVERRKFLEVGGFDAENLPIEFNDVDLCLRLAERGWSACYTPYVQLVHKESATRGNAAVRPLNVYARERGYFRRRWRETIRDDPYFHPGLSLYARHPALG